MAFSFAYTVVAQEQSDEFGELGSELANLIDEYNTLENPPIPSNDKFDLSKHSQLLNYWRQFFDTSTWEDTTGRFGVNAKYVAHDRDVVILEKTDPTGESRITVQLSKLGIKSRQKLATISAARKRVEESIIAIKSEIEISRKDSTRAERFGDWSNKLSRNEMIWVEEIVTWLNQLLEDPKSEESSVDQQCRSIGELYVTTFRQNQTPLSFDELGVIAPSLKLQILETIVEGGIKVTNVDKQVADLKAAVLQLEVNKHNKKVRLELDLWLASLRADKLPQHLSGMTHFTNGHIALKTGNKAEIKRIFGGIPQQAVVALLQESPIGKMQTVLEGKKYSYVEAWVYGMQLARE